MQRMRQGRGGLVAAFVLGLFVAGAGTATAAKLITGKQIKDGSITARDLAKDVRAQLAKPGTAGPRGPAGPQGAQGQAGPAGAQGPAGQDGAAAGVQPAVRAASGGAATIPTQDFVDAALSEEDFDTAAMHDTAANTADVVIPATGTYQLAAGASWEANATGIRLASIAVNNASDTLSRVGSAGGLEATQQVLADVRRLQAGDVVRLRVRQTSGGDLHLMPVGTFLAVARIGP